VWVKCYLNRRKLQRLLASAELPSEHPLEEQIKNSVKKKISVEQKMFRRDFLCLQSLRCNAIIKETGEYIRWEMTLASAGGEQQACISGGSQSPI